VDVGAPGGERGNVQTGGGDRVSTISLLGCSTSVALATDPTDEEEEEANLPPYPLLVNQPMSNPLRGALMMTVQHSVSCTAHLTLSAYSN